ncbi:winged helix-turn-helix transcriptional regulator [Mastigocoleus testarum]|uniref:HTH hxlR-type domain-containing protein n=1 Tax=Mastigocoleus testarum BC008 TaxID=371196 RepID=A0A0V7ZPS8_9CYAN|nr:helix-turn-helix domain-containing protein [Mastigocoleus testarum]KST66458.1 hypothetical protein BC008_42770 [Mastigocoleus testarum BC008]
MFTVASKEYGCPLQLALDTISGKWKGIIIWFLLENEALRFGEIKRKVNENSVKSISEKMLIQSLKELEQAEIISREVYNVVPPKVEYSLTERGKKLKNVIAELEKFGALYSK